MSWVTLPDAQPLSALLSADQGLPPLLTLMVMTLQPITDSVCLCCVCAAHRAQTVSTPLVLLARLHLCQPQYQWLGSLSVSYCSGEAQRQSQQLQLR